MFTPFRFLSHYVGPVLWALLPISIASLTLVLYVLYCRRCHKDVCEWVEVLLAHFKEVATVFGLLGSVWALTRSFQVDGVSPEEIRTRMFQILSTGFYSTIAGVLVSLEATLGLALLKKA